MTDEQIKRINVLYHKSKNEGLTDEEKAEQQTLRRQFIDDFKRNLRGNLDNISIQEEADLSPLVRSITRTFNFPFSFNFSFKSVTAFFVLP